MLKWFKMSANSSILGNSDLTFVDRKLGKCAFGSDSLGLIGLVRGILIKLDMFLDLIDTLELQEGYIFRLVKSTGISFSALSSLSNSSIFFSTLFGARDG